MFSSKISPSTGTKKFRSQTKSNIQLIIIQINACSLCPFLFSNLVCLPKDLFLSNHKMKQSNAMMINLKRKSSEKLLKVPHLLAQDSSHPCLLSPSRFPRPQTDSAGSAVSSFSVESLLPPAKCRRSRCCHPEDNNNQQASNAPTKLVMLKAQTTMQQQ